MKTFARVTAALALAVVLLVTAGAPKASGRTDFPTYEGSFIALVR
jgi:hypothetical protein